MWTEILIDFSFFLQKTLMMTSYGQLKLSGKSGNITDVLCISKSAGGQRSEICRWMKTEFLACFFFLTSDGDVKELFTSVPFLLD